VSTVRYPASTRTAGNLRIHEQEDEQAQAPLPAEQGEPRQAPQRRQALTPLARFLRQQTST
jgi:hypothetical protein